MPLTVDGHEFTRDANGNITVTGRAPADAEVTVRIDGRGFITTADAQGNWSVTFGIAVGSYTMDVTDDQGGSILDWDVDVS